MCGEAWGRPGIPSMCQAGCRSVAFTCALSSEGASDERGDSRIPCLSAVAADTFRPSLPPPFLALDPFFPLRDDDVMAECSRASSFATHA